MFGKFNSMAFEEGYRPMFFGKPPPLSNKIQEKGKRVCLKIWIPSHGEKSRFPHETAIKISTLHFETPT
jgi:hypothetical protein